MTKSSMTIWVLSLLASACAVPAELTPDQAVSDAGLGGSAGAAAGGAPGGGGAVAGGGSGGGVNAGGGSGLAPGECSEQLKQIYVLTALETPHLLRFDADKFTFTEVGKVVCPFSPPVYSFTISRDGTAWISATSGNLYKLDLHTLVCTELDYDPKASGFYQMQLAFAADAPGAKTETLFAVDVPTGELGTIDPLSLQVTKVGKLSPHINLPRLTGTGDAKLFAMGFTTPIGEVDKKNGNVKVMKEVQELAGNGGGLGFAQLAGDLFAFRGVGDKKVRVGRYSPTTGTFVKLDEVPISQNALIAGAAVSTCAPFAVPK